MHDYANDWFVWARAVAAPRTPGHHAYAYLHAAPATPAAEPAESCQLSLHDEASPDAEAASLVRLYVLVHEHRTGRALATRHIGSLHGVELERGVAR
jgi:hypothetical protein